MHKTAYCTRVVSIRLCTKHQRPPAAAVQIANTRALHKHTDTNMPTCLCSICNLLL